MLEDYEGRHRISELWQLAKERGDALGEAGGRERGWELALICKVSWERRGIKSTACLISS